jgi:hypothetical protein
MLAGNRGEHANSEEGNDEQSDLPERYITFFAHRLCRRLSRRRLPAKPDWSLRLIVCHRSPLAQANRVELVLCQRAGDADPPQRLIDRSGAASRLWRDSFPTVDKGKRRLPASAAEILCST